MGDLPKGEYILRRQALEDELARTGPLDPRLDKAESLLRDFARVWELEQDPTKRARLITTLFDRVWQDGGTIVAVKPREPFLRNFQTVDELAKRRAKQRGVESGSDGTRTRDLRRDRPSRAQRRPTTNAPERAHLQALFGLAAGSVPHG
jgi:hypothetical protein